MTSNDSDRAPTTAARGTAAGLAGTVAMTVFQRFVEMPLTGRGDRLQRRLQPKRRADRDGAGRWNRADRPLSRRCQSLSELLSLVRTLAGRFTLEERRLYLPKD